MPLPEPTFSEALAEAVHELRRHLAWHEDAGLDPVLSAPVAKASLHRPSPALVPSTPSARVAPAGQEPVPAPAPARGEAAGAPEARVAATQGAPGSPRALDEIRRELGECRRCKLCEGRTRLVFGAGNPRAQLVFVGEGPGAEEDLQGLPFVGKAGQLLTRMIEAMGFSRDEVYICNVVKCRPPNNRNPEPDEIEACEPFLKAQLRSIGPKAIVALGKFASQTLLRDTIPITRMRGRWREYEGVRLMPTFHPAYLLRNPGDKRLAWEDLQQVMTFFGKGRGASSA